MTLSLARLRTLLAACAVALCVLGHGTAALAQTACGTPSKSACGCCEHCGACDCRLAPAVPLAAPAPALQAPVAPAVLPLASLAASLLRAQPAREASVPRPADPPGVSGYAERILQKSLPANAPPAA